MQQALPKMTISPDNAVRPRCAVPVATPKSTATPRPRAAFASHRAAADGRPPCSTRLVRVLLLPLLLAALSFASPASARASAWADALASMSVEQKVGQLFCVAFKGDAMSPELRSFIEKRHVGGLVFYDSWGNVSSPRQVAQLARDAQRAAMASGQPGLFLSVDQEGGPVARLRDGFAVPPSNMAIGASGEPQLASLAALVTAEQMHAVGLNMNFAPVADVNSNPANPIIGVRSFGPTMLDAAMMADVAVRAYSMAGIISVAKHFPGHGDTGFDSHLRLPTLEHDRERLDSVELPPFMACITAKVPAVMTAHVEVPALEPESGIPATLSRRILSDLLRGEMEFQGLIVTDSMGMGAIRKHFGIADAALRAFQAGADILLYGADKGASPADFTAAWDRLVRAVRDGEISMERLDDSVRRILMTKAHFGILAPALPDPAQAAGKTGTGEQRAIVRAMAAKGIIIGRDHDGRELHAHPSGPVLPLDANAPALLLWPGMKPTSMPAGGLPDNIWAMPLPRNPSQADIDHALDTARGYDTVIVFTAKADKRPGQAALVNALAATSPRLAVASLDTPYDIDAFPDVPCWLLTFSDVPASVSATLDVLFGRIEARGKLPLEIPGVNQQSPICNRIGVA